jgi:hypothetical protein
MHAGIAMGASQSDGSFSARLMGPSGQCCQLDTPYFRWCLPSWPHDGDHEYNRERDTPLSAPGQY